MRRENKCAADSGLRNRKPHDTQSERDDRELAVDVYFWDGFAANGQYGFSLRSEACPEHVIWRRRTVEGGRALGIDTQTLTPDQQQRLVEIEAELLQLMRPPLEMRSNT